MNTQRRIGQRLALALGSLAGWRLAVEMPLPTRCVVIGAPHTSNWDLAAMLYLMWGTGIRLRWLAKEDIFRSPLGWLWGRLGGWPVDRRSRNNLVGQIVDAFRVNDDFRVAIVPEGTRSRAGHWKTGFYYVALGAGVPIALAYADYRLRTVGVGPLFMPTGHIEPDFEIIRAFYGSKTGKHPELQGEILLQQAGDILPARPFRPATGLP